MMSRESVGRSHSRSRGRRLGMRATLTLALLAAAFVAVSSDASRNWSLGDPGLGAWETCDTCDECLLDPVPTGSAPPRPPPGPDGKTHCARCLGCNVVLSRLPTRADASPALDNATVKLNVGRSGAAVFRGVTPDRGAVFVKMLCGVPGGYRQHENLGPTPETCKDADPTFPCPHTPGALGHGRCATAHLTAIDRVARDANLSRVSPSSWTTTLRTFLPRGDLDDAGGAKLDDVPAQMFEPARGVPVLELLAGGPGLDERAWSLMRRVDGDSVLAAATWDFLLGETDRHFENVYFDVDADPPRVTLIDNDGAMRPRDGISSVFLPGTRWWHVHRRGEGERRMCCRGDPAEDDDALECGVPWMTVDASRDEKDAWDVPTNEKMSPELLFDVRCHVPGMFVGTNLPPGTEPFLRRVAALTVEETVERYGLTHVTHAARLKQRVDDLLAGGFEHALMREFARQPIPWCETDSGTKSPVRWRLEPPCCALAGTGRCAARAGEGLIEALTARGREAREIRPGNEMGEEARRLYGQPATVEAPRKRDDVGPRVRLARPDENVG